MLDVLQHPPREAGHILAYKTEIQSDDVFNAALAAMPQEQFVIYGMRKGAPAPPNVAARAFDEAGFLRDLASSRAVISNGGMSLLGEALSMGKPVLAIPVGGHHEQILNACYLERLGFGVGRRQLDALSLRAFVRDIPAYRHAIARSYPPHDQNERFFATLDRLFP